MLRLEFDGLVNARDLGGIGAGPGRVVRRGRVFRSETPQLMSEGDIARALGELGVVRVIDLRNERTGDSGPLGHDGRGVRLDFFGLQGDRYSTVDLEPDGFLAGQLDVGGEAVRQFFGLVATAPGPTWVHCHTGKDRTGFVIALLLGVLGVGDDDIVTDYLETSANYDQMLANLAAAGRRVPDTAPPFARHRPSDTGIRAMLDRLHSQWGGARAFALANDVDDNLLDRLVEQLTEPL